MKKNRLREADPIVEENNINETPMQASTQDVANAQASVDTPVEEPTEAVEEAPTSQETLEVPEGSTDVSDSEVGGGLGDAGVGGMSSGNVAPEFGDGVKVNPETVSMEIQVPTEQLASAVAQATGDVVPAETAPDVEMAKENELVAQEQEEAEPSMEGGEASSPLEAEPSMGEESMEQSVPVDSLSTEEPQPQSQPMGESKKKKLSPSKKVDLKFKKKLDSIINNGVENMAKSLKESEEDFEVEMPEGLKIDGDSVYYNGEYVGFIGNSKNCIYVSTEDCKEAEDYFLAKDWIVKEKYDFGKPIYESEEPKDRDFEEDFEEDSEIEEEYSEDLPEGYENEGMRDESLEGEFQDVSDADVSEFMGRLQGYLDSEETTPQDVSDALRTSADFMDMVGGNTSSNTPLMDSIRDSDDLDFDSLIDGDYEDGEVRDAVEEEPVRRAPRDFDDDFEEALVRKPCKFPKDRTSIKESKNRKAQRLQETKISYDLLDGNYQPWSGAVDTWNTIEDNGLLEDLDALLEDLYPDGLSESELNDLLWFDSDWILESLGISEEEDEDDEDDEDEDDDFIDDEYDGSEFIGDYEDEEDFEESRKSKLKSKLKEASEIIYPAGSGPSESSALYRRSSSRDSNLVRAHEKVVEGRRNAIRNFHESIDRKATSSNRRFNEALRTPMTSYTNSRDNDASSWKNNRFIDKYEESQKLDFNTLLNEGFLG